MVEQKTCKVKNDKKGGNKDKEKEMEGYSDGK